MAKKLQCDFCGSKEIKWSYPAMDFAIVIMGARGAYPWESTGGWAACDTCHEIIEAGDAEALIDRTLLAYPVLLAGPKREGARELIEAMHAGFTVSRTGPAEPYNPSAVSKEN